jgi:hypothetical protein
MGNLFSKRSAPGINHIIKLIVGTLWKNWRKWSKLGPGFKYPRPPSLIFNLSFIFYKVFNRWDIFHIKLQYYCLKYMFIFTFDHYFIKIQFLKQNSHMFLSKCLSTELYPLKISRIIYGSHFINWIWFRKAVFTKWMIDWKLNWMA